jgi:hypothetical protein
LTVNVKIAKVLGLVVPQWWKGLCADSEEKRGPVSDINAGGQLGSGDVSSAIRARETIL